MRIDSHGPHPAESPSTLERFLNYSPFDEGAWEKSRSAVLERTFSRKELAYLLRQYNESIGNDSLALGQIAGLEDPRTVCAVTGHQLGLMGGPAYAILKGISCLALAKKYRAIPIYWLATEDHDVGEIDHTYLVDPLGNLKKYSLKVPHAGGAVEDLAIAPEHTFTIASFLGAVGQPQVAAQIAGSDTFAAAMAKFLAYVFRGTGLVFLEPRILRPLAVPFFRTQIAHADRIRELLEHTTQQLKAAGGEAPIAALEDIRLFMKVKGIRTRIKKGRTGFIAGMQEFTQQQLLERIERNPELFSPDAAARPVLQSLLLPAAAYIAGPAELAYHRQLKDYYAFHKLAMPWIVPRISATCIPPYIQELLSRCRLNPWDPIPREWTQWMPELDAGLEAVRREWGESAQNHLSSDVSRGGLETLLNDAFRRFRKKVVNYRLKRRRLPKYSLHVLNNYLYPHGKLQERVLNWQEFQKHTTTNLVREMLNQFDFPHPGHLYIYL